jgi:vWA domain found in the FtsH ternary systems/N-terminal helical region fused to the FtsH ternary system vWA domain
VTGARGAHELRSTAEVASWLAVGLALRRVPGSRPPDDGDDETAVGRAIAACANELPALPPPGVIADLQTLLTGARPALAAPIGDEALRAALRAYDDDVLARLLATPRFDDVLAAYAHAAPADHAAAIALVVGAVCERAGFTGVSVSPAALRRALARPRDERHAAAFEGLRGGTTVERLAEAYHQLARGARQARALVDDREVFAVDHLAVLGDLGSRMTAAHLHAAAEAIAQRLPRRLPARRQLRGARDTRLADDSLYPAGGFASITAGGATTGNIENLVTSELVYMEEEEEGIDLFSLRYVEGELLHYTRDDSVFRRHRHLIAIALGADLAAARVKDRGLPWQRLILALGLVIAAIRWLADQLGDEALTVHVGFPPGLLVEEREIVAVVLAAELARGTAVIVEQPWRETVALAATAPGAIADLVVVSLGATPELPRGTRALQVDLSAAAPVVRELAPRPGPPAEPGAEPWSAWCDAAEDLLRWLI